jgi:hypothetical protein
MVTLTYTGTDPATVLELPNCEMAELVTKKHNVQLFVSKAGVPSQRRRLPKVDTVNNFTIKLKYKEQRVTLTAFYELSYGHAITIDTGDSPLGIFNCIITSAPFQIVEERTNYFKVEFKATICL